MSEKDTVLSLQTEEMSPALEDTEVGFAWTVLTVTVMVTWSTVSNHC